MSTTKTKRNQKKPHPKVRFPGITEDAAALGVTRPHLWMVLTGARVSKRLTTRYREHSAKKKGGAK